MNADERGFLSGFSNSVFCILAFFKKYVTTIDIFQEKRRICKFSSEEVYWTEP